jgi:MFS transporter (putative signal transducer)
LFGGGALVLANQVGNRGLVALLIATILSVSLVVLLVLERPVQPVAPAMERVKEVFAALARALRQRSTWAGFAFAATAGAAFKATTALAGPFLLDQGVSQETIGGFFLLPVVVAMGAGALIGGRLADRFRRLPVVAVSEASTALVVLAIGLLAAGAAGSSLLLAGYLLLYFAIGLATASAYALLMDLTDPRVAATQFCFFMAGINLCEAWSTRLVGELHARIGYASAFQVVAALSLLSLSVLFALRRSPSIEAESA